MPWTVNVNSYPNHRLRKANIADFVTAGEKEFQEPLHAVDV